MADLEGAEYFFNLTSSQDLSAGPFDYTTALDTDFKFLSVTISGSQAFSQDVTVSLDAGAGSDYDSVLGKKTVTDKTDVNFSCCDCKFKAGDEIRIQVTNTGTPATTVYMKFIAEQQ